MTRTLGVLIGTAMTAASIASATTALDFSGVDRVFIDEDAVFQSNFTAMTLEFWIKPAKTFTDYTMVVHRHDAGGTDIGNSLWWAGLANNGALTVTFNARPAGQAWSDGQTTVIPTPGQWIHVAGTWNGVNGYVYTNGVQVRQYNSSAMTQNGAGGMAFGGTVGGASTYRMYEGALAEVRLWNVMRTQEQIEADMLAPLAGDEPGLIGYWPLDEGSGSDVFDQSQNSNDGTISGTGWTWAEDGPPIFYDTITGFALRNPVTGSARFVNDLTVDVDVALAPTADVTAYILSTTDDSAPAAGDERWGALPETYTFATADEDDQLLLYLWVKDAEDVIEGDTATIIYTMQTTPSITSADGITVTTYPDIPIVIALDDLNVAADGGTHGSTDLDIVTVALTRTGGSPADQTPDEPYVTLVFDSVGTNTVALTLTATNEAGNASTPFHVDIEVRVPAFAGTTANRIWEGAAVGELNRNWILGDNWSDGTPPANPTTGRITFNNTDLSDTVAKRLAPIPDFEGTTPTNTWRINDMRVVNTTGRHLLDLGGQRLQTVQDLYVQRASGSAARLHLSGGGRLSVGRDVLVNQGHLVFGDTTIERHPTLDRTIRTLTAGTSGGSASVDLRGTTIEGGILDLTNLSIGIGRGQGLVYIDDTTDIDTLRVTGTTWMNAGQDSNARIGAADPARNNDFYLPDGLHMVFGNRDAGAAGRGALSVSYHTEEYIGGGGYGRFAAGNGGSFDAWLSILRVGHNTSRYQGPATGTLDLRGVDTFSLDATEVRIGTRISIYNRVVHGWVYFPAGTSRVDRLYMGDNVASIASRLDLTGTVLEIDELLDLRDTGTNTRLTARVLGTPSGLDLAADATITTTGVGTPRIYLRFEEAPDGGQTPHWGLRQSGDHAVTIAGWVDSGLIVPSMHFDGAENDYQMAVYYDSGSGYTYAGLLDAGAELPPVIAVQDLDVEVRDQSTIRIGPDDLLAGVNNPSNIEELSRAISHASLGGTEQPYLDFPTDGALPVTYTDVMVTLHFAGDVTVSDTADLTFLPAAAGVTANLTWEGRARLQHDARREWQWSLNWSGDAPPANPTAGTLTFGDDDTDAVVAKRLAPVADWEDATPTNAWQIGSLRAGNNAGWHVIDLDGQVLRTTGQVLASRLASGTARMQIQNGTLDVGTNLRVHNNSTLDLSGMGGSPLGIGNNLEVRSGGTLTLDGGVVLPSRFARLDVGYSSTATLDLRGTPVSGGVLNVDELVLGGAGGGNTGTLYLDATTLHTLIVSNTVHFNAEGQRGGANIGAPNPARGNAWFLPPNVNLRFGSEGAPAQMIVGFSHDWTGGGFGRLAADTGGTCEAWLSLLTVGWATGNNETAGHSQLLLGDMDDVSLSAATVNIGVGDAGRTPKGTVTLPPGTATIGNMTIGHVSANANSIARLDLNDTRLTLTETLTMFNRAVINVSLSGERAAGLELPALPALPTGAAVNITFAADPVHSEQHYGLKITGDVVDDLLIADWLSVDDDALTGRKAEIFRQGGDTYVGIPPPPGSLFLLH